MGGERKSVQLESKSGKSERLRKLETLLTEIRKGEKADRNAIKKLLDQGVEINTTHPNTGVSKTGLPLAEAIWVNRYDIASLLLERKADPNYVDNKGRRPIHWAADAFDSKYLKLLITYESNLNIASMHGKGRYPTIIAINNFNLANVKLLLEHKAVLKDYLLHLAIAKRATSNGSHPYGLEHTDYKIADNIIKCLIEHKAPINAIAFGGTPLRLAHLYKQEELVKLLLENKADPTLDAKKVDSQTEEKLPIFHPEESPGDSKNLRTEPASDSKASGKSGFFSSGEGVTFEDETIEGVRFHKDDTPAADDAEKKHKK